MTDRRVLARLRITPCGPFDSTATTITLEQRRGEYGISVVERDVVTRRRSQRRVPIGAGLVERKLAELRRMMVPAFPVGPTVCDGEYVELEIEGENSTLKLGWLSVAPDGAEDVAGFSDWLREIASDRIQAQSPED